MWIESSSIREWNGLPDHFLVTFKEKYDTLQTPKHDKDPQYKAPIPNHYRLPFMPFVEKMNLCNDTTALDLNDAFQKSVLINTSFHELYGYTNYSLYVSSCTKSICGNVSKPFHFLTDEEIPTCTPNIISLVNSSSTSIDVYWEPPKISCRNGVIVNYSIVVWGHESRERIVEFATVPSTTVNELKKYSKYCISIAAATSKGFGNFSAFECQLTSEDGMY